VRPSEELSEYLLSTSNLEVVTKIIARTLDRRVEALSHVSSRLYWTIIVIIMSGATLVIFSGYLSSFDSVGANILSSLNDEQENLRRRSSDLYQVGTSIYPVI
jgi:hypothetical protein